MKTDNHITTDTQNNTDDQMRDITASRVGKIISTMRASHKLKQAELAEKIGLSQSQMSAIESGRQLANYDVMRKIAKALKQDELTFSIRVMAESMILKPGILDDNDFVQIAQKIVNQIKDLCNQKIDNGYVN